MLFPAKLLASTKKKLVQNSHSGHAEYSDGRVCLVCSLDERTLTEDDHELVEMDRADKSLFVQELLLALLSDHTKLEMVDGSAAEEILVKAAAAAPQTKPELSAAAHTEPPRAATASSVNVERVPAAATAAVPRANRIPVAGSMPPVEGNRAVPNQPSAPGSSSRSAVVKRKPLPASTRTGKDSVPTAAAGSKRH